MTQLVSATITEAGLALHLHIPRLRCYINPIQITFEITAQTQSTLQGQQKVPIRLQPYKLD